MSNQKSTRWYGWVREPPAKSGAKLNGPNPSNQRLKPASRHALTPPNWSRWERGCTRDHGREFTRAPPTPFCGPWHAPLPRRQWSRVSPLAKGLNHFSGTILSLKSHDCEQRASYIGHLSFAPDLPFFGGWFADPAIPQPRFPENS